MNSSDYDRLLLSFITYSRVYLCWKVERKEFIGKGIHHFRERTSFRAIMFLSCNKGVLRHTHMDGH